MATLGNAVFFGDLSIARQVPGAASSPQRFVAMGGVTPTYQDVIEYVQFSHTGDAIDFGDLSTARHSPRPVSNGHGGLG